MSERPADETSRSEQPYIIGLDVAIPARQPALVVTLQQWNYIKACIRSIRSQESLWLSLSLSFFSMGISFLIGALSLAQFDDVSVGMTVGFWMAVAVGFVGACLCLLFYNENRNRREDYIAVVVKYMDDIEQLYEI